MANVPNHQDYNNSVNDPRLHLNIRRLARYVEFMVDLTFTITWGVISGVQAGLNEVVERQQLRGDLPVVHTGAHPDDRLATADANNEEMAEPIAPHVVRVDPVRRWYEISAGNHVGVFAGPWPRVARYVVGVPGAAYMAHNTREEAQAAFDATVQAGATRIINVQGIFPANDEDM